MSEMHLAPRAVGVIWKWVKIKEGWNLVDRRFSECPTYHTIKEDGAVERASTCAHDKAVSRSLAQCNVHARIYCSTIKSPGQLGALHNTLTDIRSEMCSYVHRPQGEYAVCSGSVQKVIAVSAGTVYVIYCYHLKRHIIIRQHNNFLMFRCGATELRHGRIRQHRCASLIEHWMKIKRRQNESFLKERSQIAIDAFFTFRHSQLSSRYEFRGFCIPTFASVFNHRTKKSNVCLIYLKHDLDYGKQTLWFLSCFSKKISNKLWNCWNDNFTARTRSHWR